MKTEIRLGIDPDNFVSEEFTSSQDALRKLFELQQDAILKGRNPGIYRIVNPETGEVVVPQGKLVQREFHSYPAEESGRFIRYYRYGFIPEGVQQNGKCDNVDSNGK